MTLPKKKERLGQLADKINKLPLSRIEQVERVVNSMGKVVVSLREAAEILDVSVDTVRRAVRSGALKAFQINRAGNWKIKIEDLEQFMNSDR